MKKYIITTLLVFALLAGVLIALPAQAAAISVKVDGQTVVFPDQQPFADQNSRVQVPIRFPMEAMGVTAEWLPDTQQAKLTKGSTVAFFTLGSSGYTVNGSTKTMDTVPIAMNNRTLFPIRFAAEAFGATATWDGPNMTALIATGQTDIPEPKILKRPDDASQLSNTTWMGFYPAGSIIGIKVTCVNNDAVNLCKLGRLDQNYCRPYELSKNQVYGADGSYQIQPGEELVFDVWAQYVDQNHKTQYAQALNDYTFTVPTN